MSEPIVRKRKISDYKLDHSNANKGTERGDWMLEQSVRKHGPARSAVSAADDSIPAGNGTLEAMMDAGIEDVIEVETDGSQMVIVKRRDWQSVDDPQARSYAYYDNRTSELRLDWNVDQLLADVQEGFDFDGLFYEDELERILGDFPDGDAWGDAFGGLPDEDRAPFRQMTFTLHDTQADLVIVALKAAKALGEFVGPNENSNGNALTRICEMFIAEVEHGIG